MLKALDILIGVATVMLVMSIVVTAVTQYILHLLQRKGADLRSGIADLLQQIAPEFKRDCAERISDKILRNPLVREAPGRLGTTVHREELARLFLEMAFLKKGTDQTANSHMLEENDRQALSGALEKAGISDPQAVLTQVGASVLQWELKNPDLPSAVRSSIALLENAKSAFLAKLFESFDPVIDRVVERFTANTRVVAFACSLVLALFLQLDAISLVNRLSVDDGVRNALVRVGYQLNEQQQSAATAPTGARVNHMGDTQAPPSIEPPIVEPAQPAKPTPPPETQTAAQLLTSRIKSQQDHLLELAALGVVDFPRSASEWASRWDQDNIFPKLLGILLSAILMSLGAPFWYKTLKNVIQLRSPLASRDDSQRKERQTLTPATGTATAPAAAMAAAQGSGGSVFQI